MNDTGFGAPDPSLALVDDDQKITTEWLRFFTRISQLTPERKISTVSPAASPFTYSATTIGHLLVRGGAVSAVTLVRGTISIICPTSGFIPMSAKDSVVITYTVAPVVNFIPSARA